MTFKHFLLGIFVLATLTAPARAMETLSAPARVMETISPEGVQEGFIQVNGGRIWYRAVGTHRTGTPLLALHGGPGGTHDYLEPLEEMADERMVVFFDQIGSGKSDIPDDPAFWTIENYLQEITAVRQALNLGRVHVLGHSWGSMLALDYALGKPAGVVSLTLSGPILSASRFIQDVERCVKQLPPSAQRAIKDSKESGEYGGQEYQDALNLFYMHNVCRLYPWPRSLNRSMQSFGMQVYEYMWGPSELSLTGTLKDFERVDRLKELALPALFTCGRFDQATPASTAFYQSQLAGSELVVFENAAHEHHLEKKEEYLRTLRAFLSKAEKPYDGIMLTRNGQVVCPKTK